jgi:hypothetical protein
MNPRFNTVNMRKIKRSVSEEDILNTNETIHDYSFYFQMICENKIMDFDADKPEKLLCEERF